MEAKYYSSADPFLFYRRGWNISVGRPFQITWRKTPVEKKFSSNERAWKMQKKWAITDLNAPNGARDIPFQSQEFEQDGRTLPFCRSLASFSLKCDVICRHNPARHWKMKVQYFTNLLLDLFEILQDVRSENQRFHRADSRIRLQWCLEITVDECVKIAKY